MSIKDDREAASGKFCPKIERDCITTKCMSWEEQDDAYENGYEYATWDSKPGWFSDWSVVEEIRGKETYDHYYKGCSCSQKYDSCSCDPPGWYKRERDAVVGYKVRKPVKSQTQTSKGFCVLMQRGKQRT